MAEDRDQHHIHEPGLSDDLVWEDTIREPFERDVLLVRFLTNRGEVHSRYHPISATEKPRGGVVWVGGAGGGFDGPARGLYVEACRRLQPLGIAGLRLDYRNPNEYPECVLDTLLGIEFLAEEGIQRIVLVGHSLGGAVVITAGAMHKLVHGVAALSTQTYGTDLAPELAPRALLLVHGVDDEILPDRCSRQVFQRAKEPKKMQLYPGARHGLDEVRQEVLDLMLDWIPEQLSREMEVTKG